MRCGICGRVVLDANGELTEPFYKAQAGGEGKVYSPAETVPCQGCVEHMRALIAEMEPVFEVMYEEGSAEPVLVEVGEKRKHSNEVAMAIAAREHYRREFAPIDAARTKNAAQLEAEAKSLADAFAAEVSK